MLSFLRKHPRPPSYQHLRSTLLLPLSSVKLPCLQGQFTQGFPHCLCFRGHLQGLQEGCSPGEEARCRSEEAESDREKQGNIGAGREEGRHKGHKYLPFLSRVFLGSQGPMSCGSLRGHCRCPLDPHWLPTMLAVSSLSPGVVAVINSCSKLNQALVQGVRHSSHTFRYHDLCLPTTSLQADNITLKQATHNPVPG